MLKAVLSKVTTVLISDSTVFKGFYIVRVGIIVENRRLHKLAPSVRPFCPKNGPLVRSMSVMAILRQVSAAPVCYSAFLGTSVRAATHVNH